MWPLSDAFPDVDLDLSPIDASDADAPGPDWVSASSTRNWAVGDPLVDWLNRHGRRAGYVPDHDLPGYDARFDFVLQTLKRALAFQDTVMQALAARFPVRTIAGNPFEARRQDRMEETIAAMKQGVPVIAQGVLWDPDDRIDGVPDLLIRSDVLAELFHEIVPPPALRGEGRVGGLNPHYVVVDIKFNYLQLLQDGTMSAHHIAAMVQNWLYNRALGKTQGFTPPASYVLGRQLFDRLGRVPHNSPQLEKLATDAVVWLRRVRTDGGAWQLLPEPTIPELRPNLKAAHDIRWHSAREQIAVAQGDLTVLPYVGPSNRKLALDQGVSRWDDPRTCGRLMGMKGEERRRVDAVLAANRSTGADPLLPPAVSSNVGGWLTPTVGDLYVWLEAVRDERPVFYLVAWGWNDARLGWQSRHRVSRELSLPAQVDLVSQWRADLDHHAAAMGLAANELRLFYWGGPMIMESNVNWFDVLENIIYKEPVAVRGCFGFGLTELAKALNQHGVTDLGGQDLPAFPNRALSAMAGAYAAAAEASEKGCLLEEAATMGRIVEYAEASCRSMSEFVGLLRGRAAGAHWLAA